MTCIGGEGKERGGANTQTGRWREEREERKGGERIGERGEEGWRGREEREERKGGEGEMERDREVCRDRKSYGERLNRTETEYIMT